MYTKILVPLDGSKLAECVIPHVEAIATGCYTQEVTLVSVTEKLNIKEKLNLPGTQAQAYHVVNESGIVYSGMFTTISETRKMDQPAGTETWVREVGKLYSQADKYLHRIQRNLIKKGLNVQTSVLIGNPAEAIVSYAVNKEIDLIIMASHGRSGISRWASGSVTEKVFRSTCVPVLMIRAPGCIPGF